MNSALLACRQAQIYITFAELGIGDALESGPRSLSDLAIATGVDQAALARYIEAAIALGLVRSDDGNVSLSRFAYDRLTSSGSASIVNQLRLEGAFYARWGRLSAAIRTGTRPPESRAQEEAPDWVRTFTLALYERARQVAPSVAAAVDEVIRAPGDRQLRILDLGGGHGAYSLAIVRRRSDVRAAVFDMPPVIEITREIVAASDVSDRVATVAGDFHVDDIGHDFDVVLLFGVLHGETPDEAIRLLATIHDALAPDGLLLIRSRGNQSSDSQPGERELFDLHMLLSTDGGTVRQARDTVQQVTAAGFRHDGEQTIREPSGGGLLVFRKDGER